MPTEITGLDGLRDLVGQTVGPSEWREITQADIQKFAEVSGDHQWIHVDPERAASESPFGTTIAHGNLTLSVVDGFRSELFDSSGLTMAVNYGWNKVRFPAPVSVGARIRGSIETLSIDDVGGGWHQLVQRWTVEIEGGEKPACVAEAVVRFLP
jgi:acyl dehydratase